MTAIQITGTAAGAAFDHYTLRYSWGANPSVNDAVVYPDCTRPPANPSSGHSGDWRDAGYLDASLLPAGITEFTIFLDVFGSGGLHLVVTRTFQIKTTAVEITAAATVNAFVAQDPFHLASVIKLIKATNDPNPAVPEISVGGSFSVTGSAYTVGCDRILTQFVLARFDAPPANPVSSFASAFGGTPLDWPGGLRRHAGSSLAIGLLPRYHPQHHSQRQPGGGVDYDFLSRAAAHRTESTAQAVLEQRSIERPVRYLA